jgi:hypothetical protein
MKLSVKGGIRVILGLRGSGRQQILDFPRELLSLLGAFGCLPSGK